MADNEPTKETPAAEQLSEPKVSHLPQTRARSRNIVRGLIRFVLMLVLPTTAVIYGASIWAESQRYITTDNAYVKANLVAISPEVSGRISELNVVDNQEVVKGDILFRIDRRDYQFDVNAKLAELEAAARSIRARQSQYRAGVTAVHEIRERIAFYQSEFKRAEALAKRGAGTGAKLDEARYNMKLARRELATKTEDNRTVLAGLGGSATSAVETHPSYTKLLAEFDEAQLNLDRTTVTAPASGVVSNVKLRLGENVRAGVPTFSLIESNETWIEANLKETQLTYIVIGQDATLIADAYPDHTFKAKIASISPATGAEFALLPPQNASGNWVKVVQRVPVRLHTVDENGKRKLRAGMTISVTVDTERETSLKLLIAGWLNDFGMMSYLPDSGRDWLYKKG
jgi:membrane fusion protein (multidrug efflux system)